MPLHTELRMEGWLDRADRRKIVCRGKIFAGDVLCSEAEGLFISVNFSKLQQMLEAREAARDPSQ
jgi:hypothetical protein